MQKDKTVSCGIVIYYKKDNNVFIYCVHPTNTRGLDIPKGHLESNEDHFQCMCRELYEETNIRFTMLKNMIMKFDDLKLIDYLPKKDLYLFTAKIDIEKFNFKFHCHSYVDGKDFKENDYCKWVRLEDIKNKKIMNSNKMKEILQKIIY